MPERVFYLWQVRSFTVRLALDFVEALRQQLDDHGLNPAEENGGLLLGRVIDNDTVEVTGFEFIRSEHRRGGSYDLGGGERCRLDRHVKGFNQRRSPKPVGYFRRHLRPGLFLDQSDFAVMSESFSNIPGIALAIRADRPGPPNAGIFFWEDGDIDRTSTELMFPFDAATLRVQGPIESEPVDHEIVVSPIISKAWAGASKLKIHADSLVWGVAAILALAVAYQFGRAPAGAQRIDPAAVNSGPPAARSPVQPEVQDGSNAPPEVSQEVSPEVPGIGIEGPYEPSPFAPEVRSSSRLSEPKPETPPIQPATSVPVPLKSPEPAPVAVAPALPTEPIAPVAPDPPSGPARVAASPLAPALVPAPAPVETVVSARGSVTVDVRLEPKEPSELKSSELKRIAGHVPLLGHLHPFRNEAGKDFVSARPAASLKPRVPDNITRSLSGEISVDVLVTIDDRGLVKNTEITKGAETRLAILAADTVRSVPWEPARAGDRNVPMNMVVHYHFNPAE